MPKGPASGGVEYVGSKDNMGTIMSLFGECTWKGRKKNR